VNLREVAKGQTCSVLLPGICKTGTEETVLAHYRGPGAGGGVAWKPNDLVGAWACSACHAAVDQGAKGWTREELNARHLQALVRTLERLDRLGIEVRIPDSFPKIYGGG